MVNGEGMVLRIFLKTLLTAVLVLTAFPCGAQQKMRDVFLRMPDSLLPYLTENNRLDFIDFMDSGMKAVVNNGLGGKSEMVSLSDEALTLQVSPAMRMAMRLFPVSEAVDSCQQVVCVITTYGTDAPESRVEVYSLAWNPVDASKHLSIPSDPYVAEFMEAPGVGLVFRQSDALDQLAHEEQKKENSWLRNIEWKP